MKKVSKAKGHGWDVVHTDGWEDGDWQIWAAMEPENALPAFKDDEAAVKYIISEAEKGDAVCLNALWKVLDHDRLPNEVLWCQAMGWRAK